MRSRIGLVVIVGLLVAADAAKDDAAKQEIKKLEGSWKVTAMEHHGKRIELNWTLVIKGDKYTLKGLKVNDEVRREEGTFTLDPSQKPKTVDLSPMLMGVTGKTRLGIYEFNGDSAKACFTSAGKQNRPKEFATKAEGDEYLWEFQRDKAGRAP